MKIQELIENAGKIGDPRREYGYIQHKLAAIIIIAFCAIICGTEDFEDIEEFGKARKEWRSRFLEMKNGIPDKDTFRRVFERLNPSEAAERLYSRQGNRDSTGKTVNIDGKTIRGRGILFLDKKLVICYSECGLGYAWLFTKEY